LTITVIPLHGVNLPTLLRNGLGSFLEATPVCVFNFQTPIPPAFFPYPIVFKLGHLARWLLPSGAANLYPAGVSADTVVAVGTAETEVSLTLRGLG